MMRLISLVAVALGLLGMSAAGADANTVLVGSIEGAINPITDRYVQRLIDEGEQRGVAAVVFTMNTPGGLIDSTYKITGRFLVARVPVVIFVSPQGARAASAGTFITMAGHVAAMAPATNIGAAHPVDSSGGDIEGDLRLKAENDAVAHIVNIAKSRGRNEQWAEDAVRKSVSIGADDAARIGVVDLIANDVADLLQKIDGRKVTTVAGAVTLATKSASVEDAGPNPFEGILHFIVDPQVAVLLFTIGTYGIIFELSNPSLLFPGIIGVIAVVLALFAFGTLDANGAGVALMVFAVVLFIAEVKIVSHGLLTAGALAALAVGTIILFPPLRPTFPGVRASVDPAVIAAILLVSGAFFFVVARFALYATRLRWTGDSPVLVGATGFAKSDIGANGVAYVAGEEWSARTDSGAIAKGTAVRVRRREGLRLIVEQATDSSLGRGAS
ncbi:MAG TPA: nodulation protein NfeD [Candidatus Limnocylindrales bacterium]|nr:nodulation protein NfeD [Candidatus Limnocylindrales bacterium]